jgi:hypothetical protein
MRQYILPTQLAFLLWFALAASIPFNAEALRVPGVPGIRHVDSERIATRYHALIESACERLMRGVLLGVLPGFCPDAPPPPPDEPEGSVVISEIMYNPAGTDAGHEWVEVMNGTNGPVDLSGWLFFDGEDNALSIILGAAVLPPGGFAVIASNSGLYLADWPDFAGTLFDSETFSLSNQGETISLKNAIGDIMDEVTYVPEQGANGDGNSLQRIGEDWEAALPTPGAPAVL